MAFQTLSPDAFACSPFSLIGKKWALLSAGTPGAFNMMTVSWGGLGVLWNKNVVSVFVRPQRYTREFLDRQEKFTLSFYPEELRPALSLCGSKSGREIDKAAAAGLTPVFEEGAVYFEEAELVLECRKIYLDKIRPEAFLDPAIAQNYPQKDYHLVYLGEVLKVLAQ